MLVTLCSNLPVLFRFIDIFLFSLVPHLESLEEVPMHVYFHHSYQNILRETMYLDQYFNISLFCQYENHLFPYHNWKYVMLTSIDSHMHEKNFEILKMLAILHLDRELEPY